MTSSPPARRPRSVAIRVASRWPTLLVAAYTLAAFSWTMPPGLFPPKRWIDPLAAGPFLGLGLWQSWDMFSPDPRTADICVEIEWSDRDGSRAAWMLTDMVTMGSLERWRKDRWRKYGNDHLRLDDERDLWQPFAEFAVRTLRAEGRDPTSVALVRWWRPCDPEIAPGLRADVRRTPWQSHVFHRWRVPPGWDR